MSAKVSYLPTNRQTLLDRARALRIEIAQIFVDAEHWNRRNPNEKPIDPDPDGELRKIADGLDRMLI